MFLYTSPYTSNRNDPYTYDRLYGGIISVYNTNQQFILSNTLKDSFLFNLSNNQLTITSNLTYNNNQIYFVGGYSYFIMLPISPWDAV